MNTFLSLILFFIALGVLITIHELGHFIAAKSFNVYCSDFSIGFGTKILKIGRKKPDEKKSSLFFIENKNPKSETTFSLGIVPVGGYVAMLGEDNNDVIKENPELKGRSIEDIVIWKKIIVFVAGIFMNFVLAFVIFFISASCFEQKQVYATNVVSVLNSDTLLETLTFDKEGAKPFFLDDPILSDDNALKEYYLLSVYRKDPTNSNSVFTFNDPTIPVKIVGNNYNYALVIDSNSISINDPDFYKSFKIAVAEESTAEINGIKVPVYYPTLNSNGKYDYYTLKSTDVIEPILITIQKNNDVTGVKDKYSAYLHLSVDSNGQFNKVGFGTYVNSYWNGWNSFKVAADNWWDSTTMIGKTILSLFYSSDTWGQLGGPVAIFTQTTTILSNYPFYSYLNTWGVISVNLALFNLLPFPGLDGWSILVAAIEGFVNLFKKNKFKANKKKNTENLQPVSPITEVNVGEKSDEVVYKEWKFPPKIKNIVSYIGLILIFALMAVVFIKDIVGLF